MARLFSLLLLTVALTATADDVVRIGTGYVLPPYVLPEKQSGLEIDIVRAAFVAVGLKIHVDYLPPARALVMAKAGELDVVTSVNEGASKDGYFSDAHISYRNYAITLRSRGFAIKRIEDLAGHSVAAFQNADVSLGPVYAEAIKHASHYQEYPDQLTQNKLLYSGRVEVVVADKLIFEYLNTKLQAEFDIRQPLRLDAVFPPTQYKLLFRDAKLRDRFNAGLAIIRSNGEYRRIEHQYIADQ
ncbi:substrate-binding periplasmic protein [Andreprevotia chitinilytica]|uniref:substrate-binding periplasmic protein n=1 Tax=Andreprevotia chitinilytica TaxID=396808 RepID=UPI0006912829|nr:transporter substrate-binding domain-containing protein [Andreprevotia chitinilytica]